MVKFVLDLFKIEKKPLKGLMAIEWAAAAYMLFTFVLIIVFLHKNDSSRSYDLWTATHNCYDGCFMVGIQNFSL